MKRLAALLLAACALAAPAFAQKKPKVPTATPVPIVVQPPTRGGWRAARWGMSVDQVLAVFTGEASRVVPEKPWQDLSVQVEIRKLIVLRSEMQVSFCFRDGALRKVVLSANATDEAGGRPGPSDFDSFASELTRKYGAPATIEKTPLESTGLGRVFTLSESAKSSWIAGDTAVDLVFFFHRKTEPAKPDAVTRILAVTYSDRSAASANL